MKAQLTSYVTVMTLLLGMASCENVNRESKDVSTNAATLSADSLETMSLTPIDEDDNLVAEGEEVVVEPTVNQTDDDRTYTETEVVQIDTISTRIVYDIRRRMIEEVDTVGATKTYEIRRKVLRRTVMLDTLTETKDEERTVAYQKGNYQVLDEKVETDTAVEVLDYAEAKREAAKERARATTQAGATEPNPTTATVRDNSSTQTTQSDTTATARDNATPTQPRSTSPARENRATQPADQSTTDRADTTSTSRLPVRPSSAAPVPSEERPTRPANNASPSDTTSTESGS
jgi:hypothetical protein